MKINDNLYYDERSAGGIVCKKEANKILWLVVKTLNRGKKCKAVFKFPKGHLKTKEFLKQAALREVEEEGKIKAKIICKLGSNNYIIWDRETHKKIIKKVTFFLMEYVEPSRLKYYDTEMVVGQEWLTVDEALEKLAYDSEKVLLQKAVKRLKK